VTGKYYFVPDVVFGHRLPVKWDDVRPRQVEKGGWKRTLVSLSEEDFNEILNALPAVDPVDATPFESNASNTILYGPPGTGKTYKTIERAVQIIDQDFKGDDHAAYKARFDVLRAKGQIEFITFHQSYSYEDFVEGLRPILEDSESSEAAYEYSSGVFKRFAYQALFDCLKPTEVTDPFDAVWKKLVDQIDREPDKQYTGLTEKTSYRITLSSKGNLEGTNTVSNKIFLCSRKVLKQVFTARYSSNNIGTMDVMDVVARGCHSHFVAAMFNELKRIEGSDKSGQPQASVQSYSTKQKENIAQDFLEKNKNIPGALKPPANCPRYVLVIDEINRGNISKILGELITLIEPDKRLGAENPMIVTLPYTKDRFAVPGNLHILGTMNTADKSIALVDVALRRRFQFEELRPDFKLCGKLTTQMRDVLDTLNRRICLRKDRDHQIGHSYFIKVENEAGFNRVFARQIIPLLQEYFYNDWEGLRFVLGEKNKKTGAIIIELKDGDTGNSRSSWQWSFEVGSNDVKDVNFLQLLGGQEPAT
jgi:5-methylcytosine-specific restriction protein B